MEGFSESLRPGRSEHSARPALGPVCGSLSAVKPARYRFQAHRAAGERGSGIENTARGAVLASLFFDRAPLKRRRTIRRCCGAPHPSYPSGLPQAAERRSLHVVARMQRRRRVIRRGAKPGDKRPPYPRIPLRSMPATELRRPLDMPAELVPHRGKEFLAERMVLTRAEAGEEGGRKHVRG